MQCNDDMVDWSALFPIWRVTIWLEAYITYRFVANLLLTHQGNQRPRFGMEMEKPFRLFFMRSELRI